MFCTQCGTPFELGQNFCKQCGARVNREPDLIPPSETVKRAATQATMTSAATAKTAPVGKATDGALPFSTSRERQGISASVIVAASLALILGGSAVIYFGTDLFRQPVRQETSVVADIPASTGANFPPTRRRDEAKKSSESANDHLSAAPQSQKAQTPPAVSARSPQPSPEVSPRPTDGTESARKSPSPPGGRDAQASGRSATKAPAPALRRSSAAGIYQTTRATTVFESASASSQVVANIPGGTRLDVVSAKGEWLEVHSRRGNPPGFIRREDAALVDKTE
jgi:hypothetical protein